MSSMRDSTTLSSSLPLLGKVQQQRSFTKLMRALPIECDVKTIAISESKDLNKHVIHDLFDDLKAYEFELRIRTEEDSSTP